jgi:hypothetical protein
MNVACWQLNASWSAASTCLNGTWTDVSPVMEDMAEDMAEDTAEDMVEDTATATTHPLTMAATRTAATIIRG